MTTCDLCNERFPDHRTAWHHVRYGHEVPQSEVTSHIVDAEAGQLAGPTAALPESSQLFVGSGKAPAILLAHWHHLIDGLQTSSLGFYTSLEQALTRRGIPDASGRRIDYREAGLLSAKREYLRITRGAQAADICAAPFGSGFFVSWWLGEARPNPFLPTIIALGLMVAAIRGAGFWFGPFVIVGGFLFIGAAISLGEAPWHPYVFVVPILGPLRERLFRPLTFYRYDTMLMFKKAVHQAVLEVVDGLTETQGLRRLSDDERKPILRDFWQR